MLHQDRPVKLIFMTFSFSPKKGQMRSIIPNAASARERVVLGRANQKETIGKHPRWSQGGEEREKSATLTMAQNSNNNFRKAHKELRLIEIALIYGFNYRPSCGSLNQWNEVLRRTLNKEMTRERLNDSQHAQSGCLQLETSTKTVNQRQNFWVGLDESSYTHKLSSTFKKSSKKFNSNQLY